MTDQHGQAGSAKKIDDEAIDWVVRMAEPDADWDAFTEWLEGDMTRAERYDRAASALRDAEEAVAALPATAVPATAEPFIVEVAAPSRFRGRGNRWIGGAIVAAFIGTASIGVWTQLPQPYSVMTAAGDQREVTLDDGSSIVLAGASSVRLDRRNSRVATVEHGEVLFQVRHDAERPFAVNAGDLRMVDLGTVFDVKTGAERTRVSVSEGAVMVDPDGAAIRLDPGQAIFAEGARLERRVVDPSDVGAWREGRLAFDDAPLAEVASDLSRQLDQRIGVAPSIAERTFRGTLDLRSLKRRPALLGSLLGVNVRENADGWMLEPRR